MIAIRMDFMIKTSPAARKSGFKQRRRRVFAALAGVLLLTVQIGLAAHGATHLHEAGQTDGCHFCLVNATFIAETPAVPNLELARTFELLFPGEAEAPTDSALLVPAARGPPIVSV
ncbi:MAG: hypothetical protein ABFS42_03220 [Candidatus Krumholzibacteriota bacterium]